MGTSATAISLPFSCVLGLLASMTSSTMGKIAKIHEKRVSTVDSLPERFP